MMLVTYLSDYVHNIIVKQSETCQSHIAKYLTNDITYNWSEIEEVFNGVRDDFDVLGQSEEWYLEKTRSMWLVIHEAGLYLSTATQSERVSLYKLCNWVEFYPDVVDYALNSQNVEEDGPLLGVLTLTAAFERALGNVYLTKSHPVPFLLRDLLKTPELSCIFGKVPIVFTQLLLGCPQGFNLRNITWHGFVSPGEIHPHLVSGIIVLIASFGKMLLDHPTIPKRPQLTSFECYLEELIEVFPENTQRCDEIQEMIVKSRIIPERHKILWKKAYSLLQSERYGYSVVLLIPLLEHCLRVLYCRANDCPARLLTAEATVFYTTLDEILASSQREVVNSGLLMLLLDMTSSLSGPRVRDRLSHGEVHLPSVPRWLVNMVLCTALATAHSSHGEEGNVCNIPLCSLMQEVTSHYRSRFHVVTRLYRQLTSLLHQWSCWQQCSPPTEVHPVSCQLICALDHLLFPSGGSFTEKLHCVKECLCECNLPTLYWPKVELELAMALTRVVSCVTETAEKVCHADKSRCELWRDRGLRSRARATALRMWSVLPDVWTVLLSAVMTVSLCYRQLPQLSTRGKTVMRLVKTLTKATENTVILCDVEKNRWTEAHQILTNMARECLQFFTVNTDLVNKK